MAAKPTKRTSEYDLIELIGKRVVIRKPPSDESADDVSDDV
jgi:hypothetical protein